MGCRAATMPRPRSARREARTCQLCNLHFPLGISIKDTDLPLGMVRTRTPDGTAMEGMRRRVAPSSRCDPCTARTRPYGIPHLDGMPGECNTIGDRAPRQGACGPQTPAGGRGTADVPAPRSRFLHTVRAPLKLNVPHGGAQKACHSAPPARPHCGGTAPRSTPTRGRVPLPLSPAASRTLPPSWMWAPGGVPGTTYGAPRTCPLPLQSSATPRGGRCTC